MSERACVRALPAGTASARWERVLVIYGGLSCKGWQFCRV